VLEGFCCFLLLKVIFALFATRFTLPGAGFERISPMSAPDDLSNLDPAFDGVLRRVPGGLSARCEYFQDRNKRWPFHCDEEGYNLLSRLLRAATPVVGAVQLKIDTACDVEGAPDGRAKANAVVTEGQRIYARKPNMGEHDVTWSQSEYGHLGLQKEYIRYKSVQRLTEAWACLQRAKRNGVFDELECGALDGASSPQLPLRWASLGGGPGFELLAVRWFFEKHFPKYDLDLVSLDLENSWRGAAVGLGMRFNTWDVSDGDGLETVAGGPVDFAIASYVFKMYMANEKCARWVGEKLNSPQNALRTVLVVSRDENLEHALGMFLDAKLGNTGVVPLMDPSGGRDDRQLALVKGGWARGTETETETGKPETAAPTFPNVPYEEHKKHRGSAGGYGTGHGGYGGRGGGGGGVYGLGGGADRHGGHGDRHGGGGGGGHKGGWSERARGGDTGAGAETDRRRNAGRW
jgi:hypothetical protein